MRRRLLLNGLAGATSLAIAGAHFSAPDQPVRELLAAPVLPPVYVDSAASAMLGEPDVSARVAVNTRKALAAFSKSVSTLSHGKALESAFRSFYAYQARHPDKVKKPLLYFVDYGLPATAKRGYVFDMRNMEIVDGPFTVAHGRGSAGPRFGVPRVFSNQHGSNATSLGLYLAQETYSFRGTAGGRRYSSIGLRLKGLSGAFNSNARSRGVVAHGAPYVTDTRAGRSEGCPAVDQQRARKLLPQLANGALVFLFAPDEGWMENDPWLSNS
jgi:hypothetical protein